MKCVNNLDENLNCICWNSWTCKQIEKIEYFKDIPWYEWKYQVSNKWKIKSLNYKRSWKKSLLKLDLSKHWYYLIQLLNKKHSVHRLVMLTFIWPSDLQVNHKNCIKTDNRLENLEYCTAKENMEHASLNWLMRTTEKHHFKTNHPSLGKLGIDAHNSKSIIQLDKNNNIIKEWWWLREADRELWISNSNISQVCSWKRKTAWWYIWKFKI